GLSPALARFPTRRSSDLRSSFHRPLITHHVIHLLPSSTGSPVLRTTSARLSWVPIASTADWLHRASQVTSYMGDGCESSGTGESEEHATTTTTAAATASRRGRHRPTTTINRSPFPRRLPVTGAGEVSLRSTCLSRTTPTDVAVNRGTSAAGREHHVASGIRGVEPPRSADLR